MNKMQSMEFETEIYNGIIKIPFHYPNWLGKKVKVILLMEDGEPIPPIQYSALEVLAQAPGQRLFCNADAVDQHIRAERDAWDT